MNDTHCHVLFEWNDLEIHSFETSITQYQRSFLFEYSTENTYRMIS